MNPLRFLPADRAASDAPGARLPLAALALAASLLAPDLGQAAPLLFKGDVTIDVDAMAILQAEESDRPERLTVPAGDLTRHEAFVHPTGTGWGGQWKSNAPAAPFASAMLTGAGFGGVGVVGETENPAHDPAQLAAIAVASGRITNLGDTGTVTLDYTIPFMEVAYDHPRINGLLGFTGAAMDVLVYNSRGLRVASTRLFGYELAVRVDQGDWTFDASEDLLADSGGLVDFVCPDELECFGTHGRRVNAFSATRSIDIPAFGWVDYVYTMASSVNPGFEGGGWAFYGDPFDFSAAEGDEFFRFAPAAAVPEPASGLLLALGAGLIGLRRVRAAGRIA